MSEWQSMSIFDNIVASATSNCKMIIFKAIFTLVLLVNFATCARILGIFHMGSHSHFILGESLFKELAAQGHQVTMISPFPQKTPVKNYRDINLPEIMVLMEDRSSASKFKFGNMPAFAKMSFVSHMGYQMAEATFQNKDVQDLINSNEEFDLIVMETFLNEAFYGFAHKFKAPVVIFSTSSASSWSNRLTGNPSPPSFIPDIFVPYSPNMNFCQRFSNALTTVSSELIAHLYSFPKQNALMHTYFPDAPHMYDLMSNTSLVLLNSQPGFNAPVPLTPNMIEVGGIHINKNVTLPADLKKFLDNSKEGVIYFALGSNLKSKDLPPEKLAAILSAFKRWGKPILWKFEDENLPEKADNIKIAKWLPQTAVLAHPNVKAFITHGGRLSTLESLYFGVPIIGIPIFAEQPYNVAQAVHAGYGTLMDFEELTAETFYNALVEISTNPKYKNQAKILSKAMQKKDPLQEAVYWVEYVLDFNGAPHLRSFGVNLPWYQYLMVDVILVVVVLGISFDALILYVILRVCKKSKPKSKSTPKRKIKVK